MMIGKLRKRLRHEEGWLVVTAIAVITMMVGIGLAIFSTVDTQQSMSRQERNRDSAFNLAESALYAQAFILSRNWPFPGAPTHPASWTCTQAVTTDGICPSYTSLQNALDGTNLPDLKSGIQWKLTVSDNGKPGSPTTDYITNPSDPNYTTAAYDQNGDNRLWVRADGWAQGKERSIVALLQLEQFKEPFPQNVITAGHFHTDNNGNKVLINTQGDSATGSQVVVHCDPTNPSCADYQSDKGQVGPGPVQFSPPPGGDTTQIPSAMRPSELARFQAAAQNNGTYFTSCPTTLAGSVVFIDFPSYSSANTCTYTGTDTWNSPTSPGLLVIRNGALSLGGDTTFYGLIYAPNPSCTSDDLVSTQGNTHIFGGVAIDCNGGLDVGESQENVTFMSSAFNNLKTTGAAGLVQNTWRELPAGTP